MPELPVLVVQIGRTTLPSPDARAWNQVQQVQSELPTRIPFVAVTSAIDLPLVDCIHLNATGLQRLGRRLARLAAGSVSSLRFVSARHHPEPPDRGLLQFTFTGVNGGWLPVDNMAGFDVLTANGQSHPTNHVINAFRDPTDPGAIRVRVNVPLQPGEMLGYGHGLRPVCNVVDEADQPLCAGTFMVEIP